MEESKTMVKRKFTWSMARILYVIIMHVLIVSAALAAFIYIRLNKIPLNDDQNIYGSFLAFLYVNCAFAGPAAPPEDGEAGFFFVECVSHGFGIVVIVFLLYCISPKLALCVGLPSSIGFMALCCGCLCPVDFDDDDLYANQSRIPV